MPHRYQFVHHLLPEALILLEMCYVLDLLEDLHDISDGLILRVVYQVILEGLPDYGLVEAAQHGQFYDLQYLIGLDVAVSEDDLAEDFEDLVLLGLQAVVHADGLPGAALQVLDVPEAPEEEVGVLPPQLL
jgi:hypothetical protein